MEKQIKRKENKKEKYASMLLLLFLTVVMLVTATYAWFTSNKTVTISTLDVNVEATSGLQISADGFNWKSVLTNADLAGAHLAGPGSYLGSTNQIPLVMEPVSTAGIISAGKMNMFSGVVLDDNGDFALSSTQLTDARGASGSYIVFDVFLKTEDDKDIYLSTNSGVTAKALTLDIGLKNAARIGFLLPYATTESVSVPSDSALSSIQGQVPDKAFIWEPNFDVHTANGVAAALQVYGITTTTTGASAIPYDGVKAAIASATPIILPETNATDNPTYFQTVNPSYKTPANYASALNYIKVFKLSRGITKVRVYMWVEGQDVDCENNASGSDLSFNIQFSIEPTP